MTEEAYIVHVPTHTKMNWGKRYSSVGKAHAALNRSNKYQPREEYTAMTVSEFNRKDTMVTVINLQTKEPVEIRRSEVGGCCDPSTERYWSM